MAHSDCLQIIRLVWRQTTGTGTMLNFAILSTHICFRTTTTTKGPSRANLSAQVWRCWSPLLAQLTIAKRAIITQFFTHTAEPNFNTMPATTCTCLQVTIYLSIKCCHFEAVEILLGLNLATLSAALEWISAMHCNPAASPIQWHPLCVIRLGWSCAQWAVNQWWKQQWLTLEGTSIKWMQDLYINTYIYI